MSTQVSFLRFALRCVKRDKASFTALLAVSACHGFLLSGVGLYLKDEKLNTSLLLGISLAAILVSRLITQIASDHFSKTLFKRSKLELLNSVASKFNQVRRRYSEAEILSRTAHEYPVLIDGVLGGTLEIGAQIMIALVTVVLIAFVSPGSVSVIAASTLGVVMLSGAARGFLQKLHQKRQEHEAALFQKEKNFIEGFEYLKISGRVSDYFQELNTQLSKWLIHEKKITLLDNSTATLSWASRYILIFAIITPVFALAALPPQTVYWGYILIGALTQIGWAFYRLGIAQAHWARCQELLEFTPEPEKRMFVEEVFYHAKGLEISFDPHQWKPQLGPIDFTWSNQSKVWISGESGIGKTTLLRTLLGLHSQFRGELLVPVDTDLTTVGYVSQNPFFFDHESFRYNLGIETLPLQAKEWIERLKLSELFKVVAPDLSTTLGPEGVMPSKGQCTRLAILRELLRSPDALLLDEPTSGLDTETAFSVLELISEVMKEKLVIISEHHNIAEKVFRPTHILRLSEFRIQPVQREGTCQPLHLSP